ncbi:hypothetical protein HRR83_008914 [Exophiala dermatitidis]|uniref:Uncharacterized protein n=1 Tax=Exophiala dermatitidis TaxID=5970 RepID=A0AAN6EKY5_EXODE|nr:hypothetical protein HRR73_008820 [Exophiala dermatitidis]KAJ4504645.1 hypothetical protein HRR74_008911 [Exophiala dermatitidis]KAJ4533524.1 hypothetical protein HRR77_008501 [Exophiala dermatitidis]KAJ4540380.1 hypothetical protein HRR76_003781 [Exophiala dermatitidis]KAJ4559193.1 hypothetical protein HRR79_008432 [Exophiala dermatitidis]
MSTNAQPPQVFRRLVPVPCAGCVGKDDTTVWSFRQGKSQLHFDLSVYTVRKGYDLGEQDYHSGENLEVSQLYDLLVAIDRPAIMLPNTARGCSSEVVQAQCVKSWSAKPHILSMCTPRHWVKREPETGNAQMGGCAHLIVCALGGGHTMNGAQDRTL